MDYDDRIQTSLAAEITFRLAELDRRRRLYPHGLRIREHELAALRALGCQRVAVVQDPGGDRLVARHPDYTDIWYLLDGHCPKCKTTVLRIQTAGSCERLECGICGADIETFERD